MRILKTVYATEVLCGKEWVKLWVYNTPEQAIDAKKELEGNYQTEKIRAVKITTTEKVIE